MFGRKRKQPRKHVVHTPECTAIHEAMLMSLYLGYGAPSTPLFVPAGGLVCTCDEKGDGSSTPAPVEPVSRVENNLHRTLVSV